MTVGAVAEHPPVEHDDVALDGGTFVDETDDVLCLWRAEFDAAAQTMHYGMDLFTRAGELWSRASEAMNLSCSC